MIHLVRLKLKLHPVMPDLPTPDPNLSWASVCPGQGWQAVSQAGIFPATVSHSTVFPPGDFHFLLGLPRSVSADTVISEVYNWREESGHLLLLS